MTVTYELPNYPILGTGIFASELRMEKCLRKPKTMSGGKESLMANVNAPSGSKMAFK